MAVTQRGNKNRRKLGRDKIKIVEFFYAIDRLR
jgi:hypothetical protein